MKEKIKGNLPLRFPIYLTLIYLIATLVIYVLCPYDWPTKMPWLFYTLNALYISALVGGYLFGQRFRWGFRCIKWNENTMEKLLLILSILSIVNFFVYLILVFRNYGFASLDFVGLVREMAKGVQNPGYGYYMHYMRQHVLDGPDVLGGTLFTVFNLAWSFLKNPIIILSMLYFKRLKIYGKIATVAYLALVIIYYISIGTNIQFLHVILLILLPVILETFDVWHAKTIGYKNILKLVAFVIVSVTLLACYFGYMIQSRSNNYGYDIDDYQIAGLSPDSSDEELPSEEDTDPSENNATPKKEAGKLMKLWISGSSYLTQGYYGMSQALTLDWTPMFGVGNSMFLVNLISGNIYDIDQFTYQVKLEPYGWDSDVRWHSIYTWLANDVSFYGVILVMALIGMLFGMMFKDAIATKNPFARGSIFFFILMIIFIPCNNQVAQSADNLFGFISLIVLWLLCKPAPIDSTPPLDTLPETEDTICPETE